MVEMTIIHKILGTVTIAVIGASVIIGGRYLAKNKINHNSKTVYETDNEHLDEKGVSGDGGELSETKEVATSKPKKQSITKGDKKQIEKLVNEFINFTTMSSLDEEAKGKEEIYDFNTQKDRMLVLPYVSSAYDNYKKTSINIFGTNTTKTDVFEGDWGEDSPSLKINNVILETNKIKVNVDVVVDCENPDMLGINTTANVLFLLKNSDKSKYGFIVQKIKIKVIGR